MMDEPPMFTSYNGVPIAKLVEITERAANASVTHILYGERNVYPGKRTWRQRRLISYYKWHDRIRDAWLVLRGKAWIDD